MAKGGIFNILIILAVLLAGLMIFLVTRLINNAREEGMASAKPAQVEMVNVLVAADNIETGIEIRPEMVPIKSVPKEFTTPDTVTSFDQIKGKVSGTFIPAGDMIFTTKVKSPDQLGKASLVLEKGKRLMTLPASFENSVSYMAKNGDHVDVLATFMQEKADRDIEGQWMNREITVTLLQNVKIFDIQYGAPAPAKGSSSGATEESGRMGKGQTVTFEVTPEEAERLSAAISKARTFRLTLRRFDDTEIIKTNSMVETELLKPFLPPAPPPPPVKVEEIKEQPKPKKYF